MQKHVNYLLNDFAKYLISKDRCAMRAREKEARAREKSARTESLIETRSVGHRRPWSVGCRLAWSAGYVPVKVPGNTPVRVFDNAPMTQSDDVSMRVFGNASVRASGNALVMVFGKVTMRVSGDVPVRADEVSVKVSSNASARVTGKVSMGPNLLVGDPFLHSDGPLVLFGVRGSVSNGDNDDGGDLDSSGGSSAHSSVDILDDTDSCGGDVGTMPASLVRDLACDFSNAASIMVGRGDRHVLSLIHDDSSSSAESEPLIVKRHSKLVRGVGDVAMVKAKGDDVLPF